ncbi:hypothetical protein T4D_15478 [Trichinella pseudospiralis]|uniref:Uncharacterized protein n=1 Tax=Trichinella pseudospiralis TaxID=6337 RepID=A0A0V1EAN4_TRIPS|nr:hypothetical protein T4D_15478 [Trichinella pseudospiralis]
MSPCEENSFIFKNFQNSVLICTYMLKNANDMFQRNLNDLFIQHVIDDFLRNQNKYMINESDIYR